MKRFWIIDIFWVCGWEVSDMSYVLINIYWILGGLNVKSNLISVCFYASWKDGL